MKCIKCILLLFIIAVYSGCDSVEPHDSFTINLSTYLTQSHNIYQLHATTINDKYYFDYIEDTDTIKNSLTYIHIYCNTSSKVNSSDIKWHSDKLFINQFGVQTMFDPAEPYLTKYGIADSDCAHNNDIIKVWVDVTYNNKIYSDTMYFKLKVN